MVTLVLDSGRLQLTRVLQELSTAAAGALVSGQHEHRLHFGLGRQAMVDELWVALPRVGSGRCIRYAVRYTMYDSVAADQHLHILETMKATSPTLSRALAGSRFAHHERCVRPGERRLDPSFFIIGQMKFGTTSVAASIRVQSSVVGPNEKELDFFELGPPYAPFGLDCYDAQLRCGTAAGSRTRRLPPTSSLSTCRTACCPPSLRPDCWSCCATGGARLLPLPHGPVQHGPAARQRVAAARRAGLPRAHAGRHTLIRPVPEQAAAAGSRRSSGRAGGGPSAFSQQQLSQCVWGHSGWQRLAPGCTQCRRGAGWTNWGPSAGISCWPSRPSSSFLSRPAALELTDLPLP